MTEEKLIEVPDGGHIITSKDDERLYVSGIGICVGIALVQRTPQTTTRGLAKIFHDGSESFDTAIPLEELNSFLTEFPSPNQNSLTQAYLALIPFLKNKDHYNHPLFKEIIRKLRDQDFQITKQQINRAKEIKSNPGSPKTTEIGYKEIIVASDLVRVIYRSNSNKIKGKKDYNFPN